jgi:hypothetical protein
MQLRLTVDEIRLLYEILHAGDSSLCERLCHANIGEIPALAAQVARSVEFDSDELDCVMDLVRTTNDLTKQEIGAEDDAEVKRTLQRKQVVLRSLLDKVSEACAML